MKKQCFIALLISTGACQTVSVIPDSTWIEIARADHLKCESVYIPEKKFSVVHDVFFSKETPGQFGITISGRDRKGAVGFLSIENLRSPESDIRQVDDSPVWGVAKVKGSCDIGDIYSNIQSQPIEWGIRTKRGCLLIGRSNDLNNLLFVSRESATSNQKPLTVTLPSELQNAKLSLFESPDHDGGILIGITDWQSKGQKIISWALIRDTSIIRSGYEELTLAEIPESYAFAVSGNSIFIALVMGDSMVGRGRIDVHRYYLDGRTENERSSISVPDAHIGEIRIEIAPIGAQNPILLVPKWVDPSATVGTYLIQEGLRLVEGRSKGIFPGPFAITDSVSLDDRIAIITRERKENDWQFRICKFQINR